MGIFNKKGMPGGRVSLPFPVYFVRHGQTDWNASRRFQGHSDIPLNENGRAQASRNGLRLRDHVGDLHRMTFVASPLSRARETLEIIRLALKLPARRYKVDDRLIEIDLGDWNGKTPDEINAEGNGAFDKREEDKWSFVVPGGESYADASERTREFLMELKQEMRGPALVVGHGASGRLLRGYLRNMKRDEIPHLKARQDVAYRLYQGKEKEL
ncbi:MAG: histidine phosphatase family protein [Pseudomonadota bacterium]